MTSYQKTNDNLTRERNELATKEKVQRLYLSTRQTVSPANVTSLAWGEALSTNCCYYANYVILAGQTVWSIYSGDGAPIPNTIRKARYSIDSRSRRTSARRPRRRTYPPRSRPSSLASGTRYGRYTHNEGVIQTNWRVKNSNTHLHGRNSEADNFVVHILIIHEKVGATMFEIGICLQKIYRKLITSWKTMHHVNKTSETGDVFGFQVVID